MLKKCRAKHREVQDTGFALRNRVSTMKYGDEEQHILPEPDPCGHVAIAIENCHRKKVDLPMKNDAFPYIAFKVCLPY